MRGRCRESELVEAPPHRAEFWFSLGGLGPLPARGARDASRSATAAEASYFFFATTPLAAKIACDSGVSR
jgi:hypothetical protein